MVKIKKLLLSGLLMITFVGAVPALAAEMEPSVIRVTGYAEQELSPDTAYVTMSMETIEAEAESARVKNNMVMNSLSARMKKIGISAEDLKTLNYSFHPIKDQTGKRIVRYKVNNSLRIKVRDLQLLSKVLGEGAEAGVNNISNIEFACSNAAKVKADLIGAAVANGRLVAKSAAEAAGGQLGKVKEININGRFPVFQSRVMSNNMMMKMADSMEAGAPELEAGTQKLSESVDMVFYIE